MSGFNPNELLLTDQESRVLAALRKSPGAWTSELGSIDALHRLQELGLAKGTKRDYRSGFKGRYCWEPT